MNDTTITRRSALTTGTLAAIAAGLLGTAGTRPEPVAAQTAPAPLTVGTVTNMAEIEAEIARQIETVRAHDRAVQVAEDAIYSILTDEQQALFRAYEEADNIRDFEQMDLYVLDFGRHLPGLHPAIWALWRHMFESKQGECCRPGVDGIAS